MFASRVNGYVKVRGVRVSLPDVENELIRHPSIQRVLVVDYGAEQRGGRYRRALCSDARP